MIFELSLFDEASSLRCGVFALRVTIPGGGGAFAKIECVSDGEFDIIAPNPNVAI
jgi:hypothetical protein